MKLQLSIIIPVFQEAYIINRTIEHLYNLGFNGSFEIIVVDGHPQGDTINAVACHDVKRLLAPQGRASQMNEGAAFARGELLLFLHADTWLEHGAFDKILMALKRKDVVGGAFVLGIQSKKKIYRIIETVAAVRSRITGIPYGDQAFFLTKKFFHRIRGFRDIPLMEDVELMQRIRKAGAKITIIPSKVQTSPRRWEREGVLYCTLRNWMLMLLYSLGVSPARLARFYSFDNDSKNRYS